MTDAWILRHATGKKLGIESGDTRLRPAGSSGIKRTSGFSSRRSPETKARKEAITATAECATSFQIRSEHF